MAQIKEEVNVENCSALLTHPSPSSFIWFLLPPTLISIVTAIFYYPSLHYDFQFDDIANIKKFFNIRHNTLWSLFFVNTRWISYWLNSIYFRYVKFRPFLYRVGNVTIHIIASILVFYVIYLCLSQINNKKSFYYRYAFWIAYLTSALFALHPTQTQTISYVIQGQLEGLSGCFMLGSTLIFLLMTRTSSLYITSIYSILLFTLGFFACGTKEIVIVTPFLLVIVDWFFIAQGDITKIKKRAGIHITYFLFIWGMYFYLLKPKFFADLFGFNMVARNNIGNMLTEQPNEKIFPLHYFISQFKVILHYIGMFIWPFNICVEYDWKLVTSFFASDCIVPLFILIGIMGIMYATLRTHKIHPIAFGTLWFFIAIAPRSSIIPSSELMADYKTYIASMGILFIFSCVILQCLLFALSKLKNHLFLPHAQLQFLCISGLLFGLGYLTYRRNTIWRSGIDFWGNVIENAPGKARAYNNYAVALSEKARIKEAVPFYKKAAQLDPNYPDPWNNLSVAYSLLGKYDLAIAAIRQSIKIQPYYPEAYNNLASYYILQKEYAEAEKVLYIALKLRPYYGKAFFNLGKMHMHQGNYQEAFKYFKKACTEADLDTEEGFKVYATMAMNIKEFADAIFAFKKLLEYNASSVEYLRGLGTAYVKNDQADEAINIFFKLTKREPTNKQAWFELGESYYMAKKYNDALTCFQKAQNLGFSSPHFLLRVAGCLEHVGMPDEAIKIIEKGLETGKFPSQFEEQMKTALTALQEKYRDTLES